MTLPDVATLILELRTDLCKRYKFDKPENSEAYARWLITNGINEYQALITDKNFLRSLRHKKSSHSLTYLQKLIYQSRPDVQEAFPLTDQLESFLQWFYTYGVTEHKLWPFLTDAEQRFALIQPGPWPDSIRATISQNDRPISNLLFSNRPFGANVIGYAFGQLGIGEDARMTARSLLAAGVPMTMLNFQPGKRIPQNDRSMANHVFEEGLYAFNIFCLTALEHGRYYAEHGKSQLVGRYNIGYWPWELEKWPESWEAMTKLVDEVWVSTQYTYDALKPICSVPVFIMPMAVEIGSMKATDSRIKTRQKYVLPKSAKLFCFSFDLNSSIYRKNPQACVNAFLQAFPISEWTKDQVGLVIKMYKPAKRNIVWEKLKKLALMDDRIHIVEETLSRSDLLALYKACDCFVSLHRAEGFGRGLAEALQLGLHVITTGYSGNIDFCKPPQADLVNYRLVKVKKGQYPYSDGQVWAEADITQAAELMRKFALMKSSKRSKKDWSEFSTNIIGQRYKTRLQVIYQK